MTLEVYLFDISRATDAGTLNAYRVDAIIDDTLTIFEKTEICAAIDARFGALNKAAVGNRRARWE